jgi:DNA-binding NarL/FixJ family response regulator
VCEELHTKLLSCDLGLDVLLPLRIEAKHHDMIAVPSPPEKVTGMPTKVLLAEDNDVVRRAVRQLLERDREIELVGEATNFAETIQMLKELRPQVIVMDLHMRDETRFMPEEVKSCLNGSQIVAISIWNDEETKALADSYGAATLLDKVNLANDLIPGINRLILSN